MRKWVCLQLLCLGLMVQPAVAQEVRARGSEAVTLGVTDDRGSIGYWHKLSDTNSVGVDFTIRFSDHDNGEFQSYQFSPGIRHYLQPEKVVSPYLYGAIIGRYGEGSSDNYTNESYSLGAQGGIGLEWFPVQSLSVGGHVGVIAEYEKYRNRQNYDSGSYGYKNKGWAVGTFNSGIQVNLYF